MRYLLELTCPRCGNDPTHVTTSNPHHLGTRTTAICTCAHCRDTWLITVTVASEKSTRATERELDNDPGRWMHEVDPTVIEHRRRRDRERKARLRQKVTA